MLKENIASGSISKVVESFWESDGSGSFSLPPDGTFNVVFSPQSFSYKYQQLDSGFYLFPIHTKSISFAHENKIFGIRVKAFGLSNVTLGDATFKPAVEECYQIDPSLHLVKFISKHCDEFSPLSTVSDYLEELAFDIFFKKNVLDEKLRERVNYILDRRGEVFISEMEDDLQVSRQALHKSFKKTLGITPKQLACIWRMNNFLCQTGNTKNLTSKAYEAGYFDQSHAIHEFKKFFDLPPTSFSGVFIESDYIRQCIDLRFNRKYDPKN